MPISIPSNSFLHTGDCLILQNSDVLVVTALHLPIKTLKDTPLFRPSSASAYCRPYSMKSPGSSGVSSPSSLYKPPTAATPALFFP